MNELNKLIEMGYNVHYAPITGELGIIKDNDIYPIKTISELNELKMQFISLRSKDIIKLINTMDYGSILFHGHSGRVDIYGK